VAIGIPDMRGIQENIQLQWNQQAYSFTPGLENDKVLLSGVNVKSSLFDPDNKEEQYTFSFHLDINGSHDLQVVPVGQQNQVTLQSNWSDPKFMGAFLPESHKIDNNGFTAEWKVLSLNRNFPQQWKGINRQLQAASFGVEMLVPVDEYQKTMRSAKYGLMIIVLTFTIFFFVEVLNRKRIHPFQYILVGLALALFYVLLLSIAEHTSFNIAFGLSSLMVLGMVILYTRTVYKDTRLALYTGVCLVAMYGFVFITIQQQDLALLFGSIGLFIILAIVMWLSRKVNWYKPEEEAVAE
jgi:inner membrane protein